MLPLIGWTTIRLVVFQKNDGRRHNNEMEPQGRTIASPLQTRRQSKTFRLGKTTLRVRAHVQAVGLNAKTKNLPALSRRGDFSLDIPFYRTRRLPRLALSNAPGHPCLPLLVSRNARLDKALIWNDLVKYCFSCFLLPHFLFSFRLSLEGSASRGRGGYCDG